MEETSTKETIVLKLMKEGASRAFEVCAQSAQEMADAVERGELNGVAACRLLALIFEASAKKP